MIWNAPAWSPSSPQFTHGFPRKLVDASHGGFLPGNVIVSSQASNLAIRRMAICDVASLASKCWLNCAGLSLSRLLNLRCAALRYTSGRYLPHYLIRGMLEHGVSFATFEKLETETLEELSQGLPSPWRGDLEMQSSDEDQQLELVPSTMASVGQQPDREDNPDREQAIISSLLCNSSVVAQSDEDDSDEGPLQEDARGASKVTKTRKRKRGAGSSSSGRSKSAAVPAAADATPASEQTGGEATQRKSQSGPLGVARLPLVGFKRDVFPSAESLKSLFDYFAKHLPLSRTVGLSVSFIKPGGLFIF